MNTDVQLQILENLDLKDLLSVAQLNNKHLSLLTEFVFKRKYADKMIKFINPEANTNEECLSIGKRVIEIRGANNILNLLTYFGKLISSLAVVYGPNTKTFANFTILSSINELISSQCSENLVEIEIESYYENFIDEMTRPFKRAHNVTFRGQFKKFSNANLTFSELFPLMKRLSLPCVEIFDKSDIIREFSHLDHLHVEMFIYPHYFSKSDVEIMMRKNPQIRSFSLGSSDRKFLETVNELLPNLESLELPNYDSASNVNYDNETYFKNVKIFTIYPWYYSGPNNIRFDNLTELHTDAFPKFPSFSRAIDRLKESKTLKKLYIDVGCVDYEQLQTMVLGEPKLIEVALKFCFDVSDQNIVDFVGNNQQMEKFKLIRNESMKSATQMVRKEFADKWNITEFVLIHDNNSDIYKYVALIETKHKTN